jgi:hypothetical protein
MGSTSTEFRTWLAAQQVGDASPTLTPEGHYRITLPAAVGEVNIYPFKDDLEIAEYRITRISDGEAIFFLHVMLDDLTRAQDLFSQMAEVLADEQSHRTTHVLLCCASALNDRILPLRSLSDKIAFLLCFRLTESRYEIGQLPVRTVFTEIRGGSSRSNRRIRGSRFDRRSRSRILRCAPCEQNEDEDKAQDASHITSSSPHTSSSFRRFRRPTAISAAAPQIPRTAAGIGKRLL